MVTDEFHDFFVAAAGASGALVGLLFVALSVAPDQVIGPQAPVLQQTRASTALTAMSTALVIALVALIPDTDAGWPALVVGVLGMLSSAAAIKRLAAAEHGLVRSARSVGSLVAFAAVMVIYTAAGLWAIIAPSATAALDTIAGALVVALGVGIGRAWELVGARRSTLTRSVSDLIAQDETNRPRD